MDIPLATNNIGIQYGFKRYEREVSTFCPSAGVDGLSAFMETFFENIFKILVTARGLNL